MFGKEEYWNQIYFKDEILDIVDRYGLPHLKYIEAHIWDNELLNRDRDEWFEKN